MIKVLDDKSELTHIISTMNTIGNWSEYREIECVKFGPIYNSACDVLNEYGNLDVDLKHAVWTTVNDVMDLGTKLYDRMHESDFSKECGITQDKIQGGYNDIIEFIQTLPYYKLGLIEYLKTKGRHSLCVNTDKRRYDYNALFASYLDEDVSLEDVREILTKTSAGLTPLIFNTNLVSLMTELLHRNQYAILNQVCDSHVNLIFMNEEIEKCLDLCIHDLKLSLVSNVHTTEIGEKWHSLYIKFLSETVKCERLLLTRGSLFTKSAEVSVCTTDTYPIALYHAIINITLEDDFKLFGDSYLVSLEDYLITYYDLLPILEKINSGDPTQMELIHMTYSYMDGLVNTVNLNIYSLLDDIDELQIMEKLETVWFSYMSQFNEIPIMRTYYLTAISKQPNISMADIRAQEHKMYPVQVLTSEIVKDIVKLAVNSLQLLERNPKDHTEFYSVVVEHLEMVKEAFKNSTPIV